MKKYLSSHIKANILSVLVANEACGYTIRKEISKKADICPLPSWGSLYPALKELETEGYVKSHKKGKKILYKINDKGKEYFFNFMKMHYKDMLDKVPVLEKLPIKDDALLLFHAAYLFENYKDKKYARKLVKEFISKLSG